MQIALEIQNPIQQTNKKSARYLSVILKDYLSNKTMDWNYQQQQKKMIKKTQWNQH